MGFLKKLTNGAKEKLDAVRNNVSKQDFLDLFTDVHKTVAEGKADDITKLKAAGKLVTGLGKMAMGKYEGSSRKLDSVYKDPSDIILAEDTKAELNEILIEKLNPRQFIYADQETTFDMGIEILKSMNFIGLAQDKTLLPRIKELLDKNGVHYDSNRIEGVIKSFISDKDVTILLSIRHQVDKYIFIDRMTKEEIVALYQKYNYNIQTHYNFQCEYCRMKFVKSPTTGINAPNCELHPSGHYKGPHKVHRIGEY